MQINSLKLLSPAFKGSYRVEVPQNQDKKSELISLSKDADDYSLIMEGIGLGDSFITVDIPDEEDKDYEESLKIKGLKFEKIG